MKSLFKTDYVMIAALIVATVFIVMGLNWSFTSNSHDNSSSRSSSSYNSSNNNSTPKVSDAAYKELQRTGEEFERACEKYNRELNKIPNKAEKSYANHGLYAEAVCWDCDDAFRQVEEKGRAFARAMRKCGQEENARELEGRLKADKRKYQSYKDEVHRMLGVY